MVQPANYNSYEKFFQTFFRQGEVTEIRALGLTGKGPWQGWAKGTVSGYFDSPVEFAKAALTLDELQKANGIYFVLNPVDPALIARANNRLIVPKSTTADEQVICHRWILIDIDPKSPAGISSTDKEVTLAKDRLNKIITFLQKEGFPEPVKCFSGNGVHALYRLSDLPNSQETTELKAQALQALHHKFGGNGVIVDQKVFNPSRITKLYGTWARKGDSIPDRPHRQSSIEHIPEPLQAVSLEQLKWLASLAPKDDAPVSAQPRMQSDNNLGRMDVQAYLNHYSIEVSKVKQESGRVIYGLKHCVFNPEHTNNESAINQMSDGKLLYQCFHNSCQGKTWHDARQVISGDDSLAQFYYGYNSEKASTYDPVRFTNKDQGRWEKPVSLKETTAPELKSDLLPGILGKITKAVSIATETPLELAAGLILPVLGTACQDKFVVQIKPGYTEPVNIWVIVALDPANRKSSVLMKMTKPLSDWESRKRKEFEPIIKKAKSMWQNQQARLKSLRGKYGKAKPDELKDIEAEILEIENYLVEVPNQPQVWSQDVTTERLGSLMAEHDEKMSILSAEGGIFDIIGGRYSNGIANLDLYLQSHSSDPVKVDRGSREPVYLERPALSFGLSPQPEVLRGLADKSGFRGKGLLARFLYLLPRTNLGHRQLESEPLPADIEKEYCALVYSLLDIEQAENERREKSPYILKPSREAYQEWLEFARVVEKDLREGGRFEYVTDWAGKLPGAAARIAGLLHCAENPYQPWAERISLETMDRSLELTSIFSSHALIAFGMMGADKTLEQARKIWRWVERNRYHTFSKRDCFNALQGTFHKVVNMDEALKVLQERNYIQGIQQKTGGRPSINCNVNPKLSKDW